ncbi:MAG: hypothetical protein AAB410_04595 [Patescibacteria group bacterium]
MAMKQKISIKRRKKQKSKPTGKNKALTALGVGGMLLGMGVEAPIKASIKPSGIIKANDTQSIAKRKVKDTLKRIFGVPEAKAFISSSGGSADYNPDLCSPAMSGSFSWWWPGGSYGGGGGGGGGGGSGGGSGSGWGSEADLATGDGNEQPQGEAVNPDGNDDPTTPADLVESLVNDDHPPEDTQRLINDVNPNIMDPNSVIDPTNTVTAQLPPTVPYDPLGFANNQVPNWLPNPGNVIQQTDVSGGAGEVWDPSRGSYVQADPSEDAENKEEEESPPPVNPPSPNPPSPNIFDIPVPVVLPVAAPSVPPITLNPNLPASLNPTLVIPPFFTAPVPREFVPPPGTKLTDPALLPEPEIKISSPNEDVRRIEIPGFLRNDPINIPQPSRGLFGRIVGGARDLGSTVNRGLTDGQKRANDAIERGKKQIENKVNPADPTKPNNLNLDPSRLSGMRNLGMTIGATVIAGPAGTIVAGMANRNQSSWDRLVNWATNGRGNGVATWTNPLTGQKEQFTKTDVQLGLYLLQQQGLIDDNLKP